MAGPVSGTPATRWRCAVPGQPAMRTDGRLPAIPFTRAEIRR
ncbi:hypothetical protein [Paracoccus chinensis]